MTAASILAELRPLGRESYRRVMLRHGVVEPIFGVRISELQKIRRRVRKDYTLALALYATGNYDAQYLAGLIADEARMTPRDLAGWLADGRSAPLHSCVIPGVAADGPHGWALGREWIDAAAERAQVAGWSTLAALVSVTPDGELDLPALEVLIERVGRTIHAQPDRVRSAMNGFVIAAGCFVVALTPLARRVAAKIGRVEVDPGETACQVPFAPEVIQKVEARGTLGKKRKTARC